VAPLRSLQIGSATLEYRDIGSGPCVVLFHGGQCSSDDWATLAARWSSRYRLILPDALVHPVDGWCVWQLLEHLGIARAALVGHSAGGRPVRQMALQRPGQVAAIVCVDAGVTGPGLLIRKLPCERFSPQARALYERHRDAMLRLRPHHQLDYASPATIDCRMRAYATEAMSPQQRAASRPAPLPQGSIAAAPPPAVHDDAPIDPPTLVLITGRGKIDQPDLDPSWLAQQRGRDVRFVVLKEFGHWPWLEDLAAFAGVVEPFLREQGF
jgi:pimeloyl-ACP methyl ester carboxylesterase